MTGKSKTMTIHQYCPILTKLAALVLGADMEHGLKYEHGHEYSSASQPMSLWITSYGDDHYRTAERGKVHFSACLPSKISDMGGRQRCINPKKKYQRFIAASRITEKNLEAIAQEIRTHVTEPALLPATKIVQNIYQQIAIAQQRDLLAHLLSVTLNRNIPARLPGKPPCEDNNHIDLDRAFCLYLRGPESNNSIKIDRQGGVSISLNLDPTHLPKLLPALKAIFQETQKKSGD